MVLTCTKLMASPIKKDRRSRSCWCFFSFDNGRWGVTALVRTVLFVKGTPSSSFGLCKRLRASFLVILACSQTNTFGHVHRTTTTWLWGRSRPSALPIHMPSQPRRDPAALTSFLLFWILSSFQWIVHDTYTNGSSTKIVLSFPDNYTHGPNTMEVLINWVLLFNYNLDSQSPRFGVY